MWGHRLLVQSCPKRDRTQIVRASEKGQCLFVSLLWDIPIRIEKPSKRLKVRQQTLHEVRWKGCSDPRNIWRKRTSHFVADAVTPEAHPAETRVGI